MSEISYSSITYEGNTEKLCNILKEKIDIIELKTVSPTHILLSIPIGSQDDLVFIKSYMESEGLKINEVILYIINVNN